LPGGGPNPRLGRVRPTPARRPSRPKVAAQAFTWLLGVLLCLGPALPALHFALVLHRICPEHGELLHVGQADVAPGAASAASEHAVDRGPALHASSSPSEHSHGHDLCGVTSGGAGACALPASGVSGALANQAVAACSVQRSGAHVSIALLSYAPKLAPPATESRMLSGVALPV
jgi:hypothetical protein